MDMVEGQLSAAAEDLNPAAQRFDAQVDCCYTGNGEWLHYALSAGPVCGVRYPVQRHSLLSALRSTALQPCLRC